MDKFIDWLQSLPKAAVITGLVIIVAVIGYFLFYGGKNDKAEARDDYKGQILLEMPDGSEKVNNMSKMEELRRNRYEEQQQVSRYWNSLGSNEDGGLMTSGGGNASVASGSAPAKYDGSYLDPSEYTEMEIYYITRNLKSKEAIDAEHKSRREEQERQRRQAEEARLKEERENSDSAYFARMERQYAFAAEMQRKYGGGDADAVQLVDETPAEPQDRRIDVKASVLPSAVLADDGIITSLDADPTVGGVGPDGRPIQAPAKATFLKSEKLVSGQRVIMRLLQDLHLSDGTVIPANTHVSGTCNVGSRLKISIKTVNYGGHIYYVDIDIYDNDGTEGIYCPVIVQDRAGRSARRVVQNAGQSAASAVSSMAALTSRYASSVAASAMNEVIRSIDSNGNVTVSVSAGYEFYVFEDLSQQR